MLENLKLAFKKQKRLVIIFLLTILTPSISLSIFGIRAIKNENFRLAKQLENEHRRIAESLRSEIFSKFKELDLTLENLAHSPSLQEKADSSIPDLLRSKLGESPFIEAVFLSYENEEPWFPLFQPAPIGSSLEFRLTLVESLQEKLKKAEGYEFIDKDYESAISLYKELARQTTDKNWQAQMVNNESRCLMKLKRYSEAITGYEKIDRDYQASLSVSGVPMALISHLQVILCRQELGDRERALQECLNLYREILDMNWNLNEAQFKSYAGLVKENFDEMISRIQDSPTAESYKKEYGQLEDLFQENLKKWAVVRDIRREIIPELHRKQISSPSISNLIHYARTIRDKIFLILATSLPEKLDSGPRRFIGLKINNDALLDNLIAGSIKKYAFADHADIIISDLEGRTLWGKKNSPEEPATTTEFFNDNFPPWKIEFFRSSTDGFGIANPKKSFFFWTILTLVLVLTFGAVMIVRTVTHELEILKLKSDFVSSVSHEFKTPLTSIKALTERLQNDKVKDSDKMRQYFSLISQNVARLTQLVRNLLDFSKIEEGKREYNMAPTNIAELLSQEVRDFESINFQKGLKICAQIPEGIPDLVADREALSQAIHNLLDNALKFSGENKEIEVWLKSQEEHVIIEVKDRGIGIPQDELGKIFDKFYQGRNAIRQAARGTGLGLTLVKHTVEAHGGKVSVTSKLGTGSTFSLILPIQKE
jgi:signal transduction histidine kinase/tetratricopeptide (TPR) repeat protein